MPENYKKKNDSNDAKYPAPSNFGKFQFLAGSIENKSIGNFQKMVHRVGRGNFYSNYDTYKRSEIMEKLSGILLYNREISLAITDEHINSVYAQSLIRSYISITEKYSKFFQTFKDFIKRGNSSTFALNQKDESQNDSVASRSAVFMAFPSSSESIIFNRLQYVCQLFGMIKLEVPSIKKDLEVEIHSTVFEICEIKWINFLGGLYCTKNMNIAGG